MLKLIVYSMLGPRLYKKHRDGPCEALYRPNKLEKLGDLVIKTVNAVKSFCFYASPLIFMYTYLKGWYTFENAQYLFPLIIGFGWLVAGSIIIRFIGRITNPTYVEFINALTDYKSHFVIYYPKLRQYDFEFSYWPVTYNVLPIERSTWLETNPFDRCSHPDLPTYKRIPLQVLAFLAVHTFGMRLIYPGTLTLMLAFVWRLLIIGRAQLVEVHDGLRVKLQACDGNEIDSMFIDNRLSPNLGIASRGIANRGNTLVICCEGNAGYYEIGIMYTPIRAGYSTLGWNHPGFGGSTGIPFPSQEQNAIDVVMQYAIDELGFKVENIVLFGWSIGAYTATFAAATYPKVKALVLDAAFDDILPIALNQMPQSWAVLVEEIIRIYADLNISQLLRKYKGPVTLVRRTNDEVICLREGEIDTNRGNNLVKNLIETRYPNLSKEELGLLDKYVNILSPRRTALELGEVAESDRKILKLISKHMQDLNTTHCTPLPVENFIRIMDANGKH